METAQAAIKLTGAYHFGRFLNMPKDNLDLFAGIGLGVMLQHELLVEELNIGFLTTPNAGVRYFISDNFGFFGRFGVDLYKISEKSDTGFGSGKITTPYKYASFTVGITFRK